MVKDYYEILGINRESSQLDIKKAYCSMVRKSSPDRFPNEFKNIREAYETLSSEETREEYDSIFSLFPALRKTFEYARKVLEEGRTREAIFYLEQVLKEAPNASVVQAVLAHAYLRNKNSGKAVKILEKLVSKYPQNAGYCGHLAHAYLERGWHKKALNAYQRAIKLDEDNLSLWTGLSHAYISGRDFFNAREVLLQALERGKDKKWDEVGLYFLLIQLDLMTDCREEVEQHLESLTALAIDQEDIRESVGWALSNISNYMIDVGDIETAKALVDRVVRLLPGNKDIEKIKNKLDSFEKVREQYDLFLEDEEVPEVLKALISFEILPDTTEGEPPEIEANRFFSELTLLEEYNNYRNCINRLESIYPDLYKAKAQFFKKIKNARNRRKMRQSYEKKLPRFQTFLSRMHEHFFSHEEDELGNDMEDIYTDDEDYFHSYEEPQKPYVREQPKIGRNEPCPCGSGKKFKKCCGF